ncbi:hypothetical protein [Streptomyces longwoodensis]|uniref:hypothetical protein n=1 Tax=Streptomyces longwoodensis TaxID=68231 RepID=UPI0038098BC0
MVRTAHVLSVAALTGAVLVTGPAARADPAAEVGPASVDPGGTVTVSVTCDPLGAPAPATLDATSDAFADGTAHLSKVTGSDDELSGPAYRGTARVAAPAEDLDDTGETDDENDENDEDDPGSTGAGGAADGPGGTDADAAWTVDGTCPAPPGGQPSHWSAPLHFTGSGTGAATPVAPTAPHPVPTPCDRPTDPRRPGTGKEPGAAAKDPGAGAKDPRDTATDSTDPTEPLEPVTPVAPVVPDAPATRWDGPCGDAPVQHGVRAGQGGTFTDSVPALAAGGLLIAGAVGAAAHRLRRRGGTGRT